VQESEERVIALLFHPKVIETALARRQPLGFESTIRVVRRQTLDQRTPPPPEQFGVTLLVERVADVEPPQEGVAGQLGRSGEVAPTVRLGLGKRKQFARSPTRIRPHPSVKGP
jgi:hypothetical protein